MSNNVFEKRKKTHAVEKEKNKWRKYNKTVNKYILNEKGTSS